jgi:glycosyltransferase involved in cell wall biosynthesis
MDVSEGEQFLDRALASLAAQTLADFEIVLLAHGASAATEAIVARWKLREPRLRVIRSPRLTLSQAHNRVARAARAPLLARLDADDVALPQRLERQVAMFAAEPTLGFAGSAVEIVDDQERRLSIVRNPSGHEAIVEALALSCPVVHSTLMVRAEAFWRAGGYRPGLNISEDYDLYARLVEVTRGDNATDVLVAYRVHNRSLTSRHALRMAIANEAVRAARSARARGLPEPFAAGTPSLRRISEVTGRPRRELRRTTLATVRQAGVSRRLLTGWLPLRIRGWARTLALAMGLRPAYSALFRLTQRIADWRH